MDFYLEITILPDSEFKDTMLMSELFSKLHLFLAQRRKGDIGVSFPNVGITLGNILRLHGTQEALNQLITTNWLGLMLDHVNVSNILQVPDGSKHRAVRRVQVKSSVERLRRRSILKGWLTEEESIKQIPLSNEKRLKLPFVQLKSLSSRQGFRLFIEHGPLKDKNESGVFTFYGLGGSTTVPWF